MVTNNPSDDTIDVGLIRDARVGLKSVFTDLIENKKQEAQLLQQAAMEGGPDTVAGHYANLMDVLQVGIRTLSRRTNTSRAKLSRMLSGEIEMPANVKDAIHLAFYESAQRRVESDDGKDPEITEARISIRDSLKP